MKLRQKKRTELFEVREEEVARRLGVPREMVREWRVENLYEGEDFGLVAREIRYSAAGLEKLRGILKKLLPDGARAPELGGKHLLLPAEASSLAPADARVARVFYGNRKYLAAEMRGRVVTVRVKDNRNFVIGMTIQARDLAPAGGGTLFDFVGRCPRGRGRW
jgi:hypothetical protein